MLDKGQQVDSHPSQRAVTQSGAWEHSSVVRDGSVQGWGPGGCNNGRGEIRGLQTNRR